MSKSSSSIAVTSTTTTITTGDNYDNYHNGEMVTSSLLSPTQPQHQQQYVFWNVTQPKTSFPQLVLPELDLITDDGSNSGSSEATEENSVLREKYSTKVDQDVAVFMMIAEKLSITDRKSTRLNSSHSIASRMPSSA